MPRLKRWLSLTGETMHMAWRHDCLGQAKAAAYSTILFFFPLLLFVVALLLATNILTPVLQAIVGIFPPFLPKDAQALLWDYVELTSHRDPIHLLVGSFLIMLWTGWGLMSTFIEGVNRAYGLHEDRTAMKDQVAAIKLLVFASLPLLALGAFAIVGTRLEVWLSDRAGFSLLYFWTVLDWVVVLLSMVSVNCIVYYFGAHRRQTFRDVIPGAVLATAIWVLATAAFHGYVTHVARYDLIYGSLGAAIILFGWMYLGSLAVLLGAEFNAVVEHASRRLPHETAPARPRGRRIVRGAGDGR